MRRVAGIFRPYGRQILVVLVAIIASSAIGLVNPLLLKLIIDRAIPQRQGIGAIAVAAGSAVSEYVTALSLGRGTSA